MKRTPKALAGTLLSATLLFAACGSSADESGAGSTTPPAGSTAPTDPTAPAGSTPAASSPPAATATSVGIDKFLYNPDPITVAVGATVTWTNEQGFDHTVTAEDGSFDSGDIATGDTFEHTFDTAATFTYVCSIHPNMAGTVIVQ